MRPARGLPTTLPELLIDGRKVFGRTQRESAAICAELPGVGSAGCTNISFCVCQCSVPALFSARKFPQPVCFSRVPSRGVHSVGHVRYRLLCFRPPGKEGPEESSAHSARCSCSLECPGKYKRPSMLATVTRSGPSAIFTMSSKTRILLSRVTRRRSWGRRSRRRRSRWAQRDCNLHPRLLPALRKPEEIQIQRGPGTILRTGEKSTVPASKTRLP